MSQKTSKLIIISILISFFVLLLASGSALAFDLQVKIPGLDEKSIQPGGTTRPIGEYIKAVYNYAIGIVGILAVVVMMFGGIIWITAFGNVSKIGEAKAWIGAALTGLVLALTSFMIMQAVNPALVNFKTNTIPTTEEIKFDSRFDSTLKECKEKCGETGYAYDGLLEKCVCQGTGSHTECVLADSYSGSRVPTCSVVNWEGTDQCDINDPDICNGGCCTCAYIGFYNAKSCTSGLEMDSLAKCKKFCGSTHFNFSNWTSSASCVGSLLWGRTCKAF